MVYASQICLSKLISLFFLGEYHIHKSEIHIYELEGQNGPSILFLRKFYIDFCF